MASLNKKYSKEKLIGQVFTPFFIVDKILDDLAFSSTKSLSKTILDPACGDGRFLLRIVERIIEYSSPEDLKKNLSYVYGWDTDCIALEIAKEKLDKLVYPLEVKWNLECTDSLKKQAFQGIANERVEGGFDFIVGNPPYIRIQHLDKAQRLFIQENYQFCKSGSTDIYIAFYELSISLLAKGGKIGFITPNTFFTTDTAKYLREYFVKEQTLMQISNYGAIQLFEDATTYSAIVIFGKEKQDYFLYQKAKDKNSFKNRNIPFAELLDKKFWQLSEKKPRKKKGVRLGDISSIHVGLTTLADKVYILPYLREEGDCRILNSKFKGEISIEKEILKPIIKVSKLKSADEPIREYIIFPYEELKGKKVIIKEDVIKERYPKAYAYLLSMKEMLDNRDNGKPNKVAWYAYGRSQGLITSFGKKILFSPMNKSPMFIYSDKEDATFYSGYCIHYQGDINALLEQLNSKRMEDYMEVSARDFRSGWKAYNKTVVQEFRIL